MTHTTEAGVGAFTYGVFNSEVGGIEQCDQLQTIDVASGKLQWSQAVSLQGKGAKGFPNRVGGSALSISDGVVSAAYAGPATKAKHGHTDVLAADVSTGDVKWSTDFGGRPMAKGCRLSGHAKALGKTVYAIGTCGKSKAAKLLALRDGKKAGRPTISVAGALPSCNDIRVGVLSAFMTANAQHVLVSCGHPTTKLFTVSAGSTGRCRWTWTTSRPPACGTATAVWGPRAMSSWPATRCISSRARTSSPGASPTESWPWT